MHTINTTQHEHFGNPYSITIDYLYTLESEHERAMDGCEPESWSEFNWPRRLRQGVVNAWRTLGLDAPAIGPVLFGVPVDLATLGPVTRKAHLVMLCDRLGLIHDDERATALVWARVCTSHDAAPNELERAAGILGELKAEAAAGDATSQDIVDALAAADRPEEAEAQCRRVEARLFKASE